MPVFIGNGNIISSLGFTTSENVQNLKKGKSGIKLSEDKKLSQSPFFVSLVDDERLNRSGLTGYTRLEKMFILSVTDSLDNSDIDIANNRTLLILSSTKGNIDLLESKGNNEFGESRLYLWEMANVISSYFNNPNKPFVISNACISGLLAIIIGARYIAAGLYDDVVVTGGDIISEFVVAGFQSFKALGTTACKPFDGKRDGLTLGEGCGTILLSSRPPKNDQYPQIVFSGGGSSNDANHISGPSRTGDGLLLSIKSALEEAGYDPSSISYINAHGTATPYNDEMESKAFSTANLSSVPLNSLKSYFGHTLGAAGIIETIAGIEFLKGNFIPAMPGFESLDSAISLNVVSKYTERKLNNFLKTASGFGGCNAAAIFTKYE